MILGAATAAGQSTVDPSSVLVLVNDLTPPETGTGAKGASVWVGEHYAGLRAIPPENVVHLKVGGLFGNADPGAWDGYHLTFADFDRTVRQPLRQYLADRGLANRIQYVVTTYGLPTHLGGSSLNPTAFDSDYSFDAFLAALQSDRTTPYLQNPYFNPSPEATMPRFRNWVNPAGWRMLLVTRLDGPTAAIAAGLVDKAVRAEPVLRVTGGKAYFDYRGLNCPGDGYCLGDDSVRAAYNLALAQKVDAVLNNNHGSPAAMIHQAPGTLWAWGWYSNAATWNGYEFVDGAVGAMLTSYTANFVRRDGPGAWVPVWLRAGITGTWGATGEPGLNGYTLGDMVLRYFWSGYTFAESVYLGTPYLNSSMVFLGDPLYAPRSFAQPAVLQETVPVTVTTSPPGIFVLVDSEVYVTPKTFAWTPGSVHTLGVAASNGYSVAPGIDGGRFRFATWTDGGTMNHEILTPAAAVTFGAQFSPEYRLKITTNPPDGGSVSMSPASSDGYYGAGTVVRLTAVPTEGYVFAGWDGDSVSTDGAIPMNGPRNVTARFGKDCRYTVSPTEMVVPAEAGAVAITVQTAPACAWNASSIDGWLISSLSSGQGEQVIGLVFRANNGTAARETVLTIATQTVKVRQLGRLGAACHITTGSCPAGER